MNPERLFFELPRIASALLHEPWMILPGMHRSLLQQVEAFLDQRATAPRAGFFDEPPLPPGAINRVCTFDKQSGLAVLNVKGIIGKGLSTLSMNCGGVCLDQVEGALDQLRSMPVKAVALHFNSPGGSVNGTEECAQAIRAFSQDIAPVFGYTDTMACSAAYWLAAACDSFHAAPSAYIGSIGVYSYLVDDSAQWASEGRKMILVASGPQKAAGFPGVAVTEEQVTALRDTIARMASRFAAHVTSRRAGVDASAFSGAAWAAQDAPPALHDGFMRSRADHLAYAYSMRRANR